jgi:hypothetical protein
VHQQKLTRAVKITEDLFCRYWKGAIPLAVLFVTGIVAFQMLRLFEPTLPDFKLHDPIEPTGLCGFKKAVSALGPWGLSVYFFAVLEVFILVLALAIYNAAQRSYPLRTRLRLFAVATMWGLLLGLLVSSFFATPKTRSTMVTLTYILERLDSPYLKGVLDLPHILMFFVVWIVAMAFGSLLIPSNNTEEDTDLFLLRRMQWARVLLYFSAVWLVAGTFVMSAMYNVPTIWLNEHSAAHLREISRYFAAMTGGLASVFLLSICVPTQMILHHQASELACARFRADNANSPQEWLEKRGFTTSYWGTIPSVLAVLGPALAGGPLQEVFRQFGQIATK